MSDEATQAGVSTPAEERTPEDIARIEAEARARKSPREEMLEGLENRIEVERQEQIQTDNAEFSGVAPQPAPQPDPGEGASIEPMHPAPDTARPDLPAELQNDPLADYVVMQDGQPMFDTKVDGKQVLIPLDRARQQLQKHVAAEVRLAQATEFSRQLDQREAQIRANEQALQTRVTAMEAPPSATSDVDDQALQSRAKEIVSTMFTGSEDEAAEKLAQVLTELRTSAQPQTPVVDPNQIARQAVEAARTQITEDTKNRDARAGYNRFQEEYPDIMADPVLFRAADGMTEEIEVEHPDWMPSQVMSEAGKRVRAWVEQNKAANASDEPPPVSDRQRNKQSLTPLPQPASAIPEAIPIEPEATPQDVLAEIRAGRGQPT